MWDKNIAFSIFFDHLVDVECLRAWSDGSIVVCGKENDVCKLTKYNTNGRVLTTVTLGSDVPNDIEEVILGGKPCIAMSYRQV